MHYYGVLKVTNVLLSIIFFKNCILGTPLNKGILRTLHFSVHTAAIILIFQIEIIEWGTLEWQISNMRMHECAPVCLFYLCVGEKGHAFS